MSQSNSFRFDLSAGFSVALVAVPLSIGISLASGAPASSGLIAAIVGGLIGSWMGGTNVAINGPAAGLIVIVLDAITQMGQGDPLRGFKGMLAAAVVAGAMQVVFGLFKLARKGLSFPVSVIHGMMAAIGLIIVAKQVHVLLGYVPHSHNPLLLFAEIPEAIIHEQWRVTVVGVLSLGTLLAWPKLAWAWTKKVPAPLVTVIVGAVSAAFISLPTSVLLKVPADLSTWIIFPDFSVMSTFAGWRTAITLALVASLETVLSAAAVDKLDPLKRHSNLDRDLVSKGFCNMLSASVGGLPMIAEIVRSSANVSYGAKSWHANFFHGTFVLAAVLFLPSLLAFVPLTALAAILLMVGSRLGSPSHFFHAKKIGRDHLVGFAATLVTTLAVDLLVGIFVGAVAQFAMEMKLGLKLRHALKPVFNTFLNADGEEVVHVSSSLAFCNFQDLKKEITSWKDKKISVRLELDDCEYVDHSVMDQLHDLAAEFKSEGLHLNLVLAGNHRPLGQDELSSLKKIA